MLVMIKKLAKPAKTVPTTAEVVMPFELDMVIVVVGKDLGGPWLQGRKTHVHELFDD